jgi:hypothetical protein
MNAKVFDKITERETKPFDNKPLGKISGAFHGQGNKDNSRIHR